MTMTIVLILAIAIVAVGLGFLLGRVTRDAKKSARQSQSVPTGVGKVEGKAGNLPADLKERVQALIDDGHRYGAVKELEDAAGLELKEAKNIVDAMVPSLPPNVDNADKLGMVRDLVRSGNKDEALQLYRASSGLSLKEAEEAIDKLEKEFG